MPHFSCSISNTLKCRVASEMLQIFICVVKQVLQKSLLCCEAITTLIIFKFNSLTKPTTQFIVKQQLSKNLLKNQSRDELNKFLYKELRRRPITMPVLISVDDNDKDKA